jgi:predicted Ser/Thr protein kinase
MADDTPSTPKHPQDGPSELRGLDPGELLARGLHTVKPSAGAGPWEPPTPEEVSRLLPQYRIEKLIGRGGMGAVYKGIQVNLDRPVAIKLLPAEMAADKEFVARFEREARTLAKLQHSRIVTIFDFGRTAEGHLYFVMEYIDGTDLRSILRGPGLDPEQALVLVGQLCDALQAAHREGIIHRDIKPENVLITRDGYVKLADFGLARPPQEEGSPNLTQTHLVLGTPDYMAPEQRFGAAKADARSDIFALGVMLYEMLTGQTPRGVFDPPSHKVGVDVRIDEVVLKALQSEPERRYQKASELKTAVENIRTTPRPAPAPAVAESPASESLTRPLAYAAAAVVVLSAIGIAAYLHRPKSVPATMTAAAMGSAPIPVVAATPAPATPAPAVTAAATPALPSSPVASPSARRAAKVYDAIVGYHWSWANDGQTTAPTIVDFNWDGHCSGGWTWHPIYKPDGETLIDCTWGDNGHEYLRLNEACDAFVAFNSDGQFNVKGQRMSPIGRPANLEPVPSTTTAVLAKPAPTSVATPVPAPAVAQQAASGVAKTTPVPASPAARRAAKVYDAIVGYHWSWANDGQTTAPTIVDFNWDGHCSGGWTWHPIYKPDGETLIDCAWGDNGHEYLRLNEACDAFVAFNGDGQFNVKGQRLGAINQAVTATGFAALTTVGADGKTSPSRQIEPLLEPSLNAILAPLGQNPQMPRVPVEKLQAVLGGEAVRARTPLQKQIYQYAIAVCESLTNGMDERALTKAAAVSSSWVPSVSNGGSIVNTMPLRGWDAGHAGDAVRKKQKDERAYADQRADQYSIFMESSAYKAWVTKSAILRQNVMALYSKLVQLEAADAATTTATPATPAK